MTARFLLFLILGFFAIGCTNTERLEKGIWRATLKTESGAEIPFNFELADSAEADIIYILNGKERFRVEEVIKEDDSLFIQIPVFESEIRAKLSGNKLNGKWIKHLASTDVVMEFNAEQGISWRFFKAEKESDYSISGRWSTIFTNKEGSDTTIAVGEFTEKDGLVSGTFLTATGDYRFLEGSITENRVFLSTFDGSNAYLFTGLIENDSTITDGLFYSGLSSVEKWTAVKDENALLPDAYSLTSLKSGSSQINFAFKDLDGKTVSSEDDRFKNKVVIVQFLGSWCPNCMDETAYLSSFFDRYKGRGVEVVGLAYERTNDLERSKTVVKRLKSRFNINYPLLITGFTNKEALKSMPDLNEFKAFPTTIIIDKKGNVRKIHTGFSGPGTGKHYTDFVEEFEKQVNILLSETS